MRLVAENLCVERGGRRLVDGLSFAVLSGGALALLGPNGSGKTSLLRALCGLLRLERGVVRLEGAGPEATVAESCHFIGYETTLKSRLTAGENLSFWAGALGGDGSEGSIRSALARVGLGHVQDLPAGALSAGQRRRVALCRALVALRPIWLLDEPTTALDKASIGMLGELLAEHRAGGGLVVAATHAELPLPGAAELTLGAAA